MTKPTFLILLVTLALGCSVEAQPDNGVPASCHAHSAKDFTFGTFACQPGVSETCGFGIHNQPVPLDQSGDALSYYCTCDAGEKSAHYSCWGAPSLAPADPLQ